MRGSRRFRRLRWKLAIEINQIRNREIGQKPTSFQNSHNLLKLQASDCWLFWCFVVSHGLMRDSNPKSEIAGWTAWDGTPSEVIPPRSCVSNLRFLISALRLLSSNF